MLYDDTQDELFVQEEIEDLSLEPVITIIPISKLLESSSPGFMEKCSFITPHLNLNFHQQRIESEITGIFDSKKIGSLKKPIEELRDVLEARVRITILAFLLQLNRDLPYDLWTRIEEKSLFSFLYIHAVSLYVHHIQKTDSSNIIQLLVSELENSSTLESIKQEFKDIYERLSKKRQVHVNDSWQPSLEEMDQVIRDHLSWKRKSNWMLSLIPLSIAIGFFVGLFLYKNKSN